MSKISYRSAVPEDHRWIVDVVDDKEAAIKAVGEYLEARGVRGVEVAETPRIEGMLRVRYPVPEPQRRVELLRRQLGIAE